MDMLKTVMSTLKLSEKEEDLTFFEENEESDNGSSNSQELLEEIAEILVTHIQQVFTGLKYL